MRSSRDFACAPVSDSGEAAPPAVPAARLPRVAQVLDPRYAGDYGVSIWMSHM
jgi:hypothetical protein